MPVSYPEIRKFSGLYLQSNSFDVPDGALEICNNVEIQSDAILSKTKGWYTYYNAGTARKFKSMITYRNALVTFASASSINDRIGFFAPMTDISPDQTYSPMLTLQDLSPSTEAPTFDTTVTRTAEENLNLYFTADNGVFKLENLVNTSKIFKAGVPPGLDLRATSLNSASGPLPPDSQTAYRILFGKIDLNNNLLLGAPSDIATVGLAPDGTGFTYTSVGAGPYTVTVTTTAPHGLSVGNQIIVTNATDPDANGIVTVTATPTALTFQYSTAGNPLSGTLDYSYSRQAKLEFSIPTEIGDLANNAWFYQVYRSTSSATVEVSPSPDFALIAQVDLVQTDLNAGFIFFTDNVDPILAGAQLYTNPNSREGELQANTRPPLCADIQLYKNYMLYANCVSIPRLFLTLVNPAALSNASIIGLNQIGTENYQAYDTGVVNRTVQATAVFGVSNIMITYPNHGASNGWLVSIEEVTGTIPPGSYIINTVTVNTFNITSIGNTATALSFSFLANGVNQIFYLDKTSLSLAVQITNTASFLVKAINRTNSQFYANYISGFDDNPGKIKIETKIQNANTFDIPIKAIINITTPQAFIPPLASSILSNTAQSVQDILPDGIYISKISEPDAVPVVNFFRAGSKNKPIKRIFTLRDSVIILKEDGIYKLTGDTIDQFTITSIDTTVFIYTIKGADKINNNVLALSNQGFVSISESSVQIISRRIDDVIQPIAGINENTTASLQSGDGESFSAFGFETGRTWYFSQMFEHPDGFPPITYLFNVLNQSFTTTDIIFSNMALGPDGTIYAIVYEFDSFGAYLGNRILRQRHSFTLIDYSNEFAVGTAFATGIKTATVTMSTGNIFTLSTGDIILFGLTINRIVTVLSISTNVYAVTFISSTNIPVSPVSAVNFYQAFQSDVKFSPFHAGQVGREKQFSQLQLHLRQPVITDLILSFSTETFANSESVEWNSQSLTQIAEGWGLGPWGLFPWGDDISTDIRLRAGTISSLIIRIYIPLFANRSTFIQSILSHNQAAEPLLIQALSYVVRGYGERVTR